MNDLSYEASLRARYAEVRGRLWNAAPPVCPPSRVRTISLIAPPADPKLPMIITREPEPVRDWLIVSVPEPEPQEADQAADDNSLFRPSRIINEVAEETRCSVKDLKSGGRHYPLVFARQYLMWRLVRETTLSLPQVGQLLSRDHTTVLHAVRRHEERQRDGTALWGMGVKA